MRLREAYCLFNKDLDFGFRKIVVRVGKGEKDRFTDLPSILIEPLNKQIMAAQKLHEQDLRIGLGCVEMPFALVRKYSKAEKEWAWQYIFPSKSLSKNPRAGAAGRHYASDPSLQKIY